MLKLRVGLRVPGEVYGDICTCFQRFAEECSRWSIDTSIPLYWNFAVARVAGGQNGAAQRLLALIGDRVEQHGDQVVPSGFYGLLHPLLLPEELRRELQWCYRNPWFPGLEPLYDLKPDAILPACPDLLSARSAEVYAEQGFRTVAVPVPLHHLIAPAAGGRAVRSRPNPFSRTLLTPDKALLLQPVVVVPPGKIEQQIVAAVLSSMGKAGSLNLLFDMGSAGSADPAEPAATAKRLFELISRHRPIRFACFSPGDDLDAISSTFEPAEVLKFCESFPGSPEPTEPSGVEEAWRRVEQLRGKKRRTKVQTRELLQSIAESYPPFRAPSGGGEPAEGRGRPKLQIANISMSGSVSLIGNGARAAFREGLLYNLFIGQSKLLPGVPARSFLRRESGKLQLRTESAFSFEREEQTGLRTILSAPARPGGDALTIILDHTFVGEENILTIEMSVRYPSLQPGIVWEIAPLELCLCTFGEADRVRVEADLPGGARYLAAVRPQGSIMRLYGKRFRISDGSTAVQLELSPAAPTRTGQIELRVVKHRGIYRLWANLGGSYLPQPGDRLSSGRQSLSFTLGICDPARPGSA